jgi:2-dehydropantoate 2-reductase
VSAGLHFREIVMRIAVIGTGGVGGTFGAALARSGADVTFVARGAHLTAMRQKGLRVEGDRGETHLQSTRATDDPSSIGPVDVVLFCVKLWDVESAGTNIRPIIGPETAVIPLQNGIDASERLIPILGADTVMGGIAIVSAAIASPGVIRQTGSLQRIVFGELDGKRSARAERFLEQCQQAGFDAVLSDNIQVPTWQKFVFLATVSSFTALTRLPIGKLRDDPDILAAMTAMMVEVAAVGVVRGAPLPSNLVDMALKLISEASPTAIASMAVDLMRGNRLELPWLAGKVVELGRQLGVPTPVTNVAFAALKPYTNGAPE